MIGHTKKTSSGFQRLNDGQEPVGQLPKVIQNAETGGKIHKTDLGITLQSEEKNLADRSLMMSSNCALGFETSVLNQMVSEEDIKKYISLCDKLASKIQSSFVENISAARSQLRMAIEKLGTYLIQHESCSVELIVNYEKLILKVFSSSTVFPSSDKYEMKNIVFIFFSLVPFYLRSENISDQEEVLLQGLIITFGSQFTNEQYNKIQQIFTDYPAWEKNKIKTLTLQIMLTNPEKFEYNPLKEVFLYK